MSRTRVVGLGVVIVLAVAATQAVAEEPQNDSKQDNKLVGTWKLLSAKYGGREVKMPEGYTRIKHVTPVQFMWAGYDKDGKVTDALGGSYTLKGETYEELPGYGVGEALLKALKGKQLPFTWKVEGNKWFHSSKMSTGLTIEEVWERLEKK